MLVLEKKEIITMKTLIYSSQGFEKPFLETALKGKHEFVYTEQVLKESTTHLAQGFEAIVLFTSDDASAGVLEKLHTYGVKHIALRCVGHDHVDLVKAKSLGIKVANVPEYSPYAIAEHSVTLLLALNRKLMLGQQLMQTGDFRLDKLTGFDLYGKTIGIVGTGKIGCVFTKIMHGFGCNLLGYDVQENEQLIKDTNIRYISLEDLCKQSDVISLNCPLNAATKYMFNHSTFSMMKRGVIFINTARGGIVNTKDLMEALDNGTVAAAGLDVYENEKSIFFFDHTGERIVDELFLKLRTYPNVLITGHQAFLTHEALTEIANTTISNLNAWGKTESCDNDLI